MAGVPLFIMIDKRTKEIDEECYSMGAMVVLSKPFSKSGILRIERIAWQYEVTKNYEKTLQKQAMDLQAAREIMRLNKQLEARNELLYKKVQGISLRKFFFSKCTHPTLGEISARFVVSYVR